MKKKYIKNTKLICQNVSILYFKMYYNSSLETKIYIYLIEVQKKDIFLSLLKKKGQTKCVMVLFC